MPEDMLQYLGRCIREGRKTCGLTQEELSEQTGISVRHIAKIEKGQMNPSYEILTLLIRRIGISGETLFHPDISEQEKEINQIVGKYLSCSEKDRRILIKVLNCLTDELILRTPHPYKKFAD